MSDKGLPSLLDRHWAESALAIGAVIIAAVSLWVAVDTERTNRELVASQSWPFVQFYDTNPVGVEPRVLTLLISNEGVGPAKLEWFELFWHGRAQRSPWQLLQACCAPVSAAAGQPAGLAALRRDPALETSSDQGLVLRAGATLPLLTFTRTADNSVVWDAFARQFTGNLSVRYCYCSAFNECWVNSAGVGSPRDLNPRQVRACPRPQVTYDNTRD